MVVYVDNLALNAHARRQPQIGAALPPRPEGWGFRDVDTVNYSSPTPWLLGGVLVLAGVGVVHALSSEASSCQPRIKPGSKILLVGDSLAVGLTIPMRELAIQSACEFQALAEQGTRIDQWLTGVRNRSLEETIRRFNPDIIFVSLGTNDSASSLPTAKLQNNIKSLIAWLSTFNCQIYWLLPLSLPFEERTSNLIRQTGTAVFESASLPIPQGPDKIHPTGKGYAGWAEHIWASITCSSPPPSSLGSMPLGMRPVVPRFMRPISGQKKKRKRV